MTLQEVARQRLAPRSWLTRNARGGLELFSGEVQPAPCWPGVEEVLRRSAAGLGRVDEARQLIWPL